MVQNTLKPPKSIQIKRCNTTSGNECAWIVAVNDELVKIQVPDENGVIANRYIGWLEQESSLVEILNHMQKYLCYSNFSGEERIKIMHMVCKILKQQGQFPDYLSEDDIRVSKQLERIRKKQENIRKSLDLANVQPMSSAAGAIFTTKAKEVIYD